jgi:hypothetical protein
MSELELLGSPEALAAWAHRALSLKNQLSIADAQAVEAAFEARLSELGNSVPALLPESQNKKQKQKTSAPDRPPQRTEHGAEAVTVISKPVRDRDREHLKFVAAQPCLVCGRTPSDPHHIKFAEQRAMARKVSDRFTVPICRLHHRELHRRGNERAGKAKGSIRCPLRQSFGPKRMHSPRASQTSRVRSAPRALDEV